MTRKKKTIIIVLVCVAVPAIPLCWCQISWMLWDTRVEYGPMSIGEARAKLSGYSLPLPDEARSIRYASWGMGVGYEDCLRFEAPPEVCKAYAEQTLRDPTWGQWKDKPCTLREIRQPPDPVRLSELKITWFDIHHINRGLTTVGERPYMAEVWVDLDRGVFYLLRQD